MGLRYSDQIVCFVMWGSSALKTPLQIQVLWKFIYIVLLTIGPAIADKSEGGVWVWGLGCECGRVEKNLCLCIKFSRKAPRQKFLYTKLSRAAQSNIFVFTKLSRAALRKFFVY